MSLKFLYSELLVVFAMARTNNLDKCFLYPLQVGYMFIVGVVKVQMSQPRSLSWKVKNANKNHSCSQGPTSRGPEKTTISRAQIEEGIGITATPKAWIGTQIPPAPGLPKYRDYSYLQGLDCRSIWFTATSSAWIEIL